MLRPDPNPGPGGQTPTCAAWICTTNYDGADPNRSIQAAATLSKVREIDSPRPRLHHCKSQPCAGYGGSPCLCILGSQLKSFIPGWGPDCVLSDPNHGDLIRGLPY